MNILEIISKFIKTHKRKKKILIIMDILIVWFYRYIDGSIDLKFIKTYEKCKIKLLKIKLQL